MLIVKCTVATQLGPMQSQPQQHWALVLEKLLVILLHVQKDTSANPRKLRAVYSGDCWYPFALEEIIDSHLLCLLQLHSE